MTSVKLMDDTTLRQLTLTTLNPNFFCTLMRRSPPEIGLNIQHMMCRVLWMSEISYVLNADSGR